MASSCLGATGGLKISQLRRRAPRNEAISTEMCRLQGVGVASGERFVSPNEIYLNTYDESQLSRGRYLNPCRGEVKWSRVMSVLKYMLRAAHHLIMTLAAATAHPVPPH